VGRLSIIEGLQPYRLPEFKPPMVFITYAMAIWTFDEKNTDFRIFFSLLPLSSSRSCFFYPGE
jgi:hypothetical protein